MQESFRFYTQVLQAAKNGGTPEEIQQLEDFLFPVMITDEEHTLLEDMAETQQISRLEYLKICFRFYTNLLQAVKDGDGRASLDSLLPLLFKEGPSSGLTPPSDPQPRPQHPPKKEPELIVFHPATEGVDSPSCQEPEWRESPRSETSLVLKPASDITRPKPSVSSPSSSMIEELKAKMAAQRKDLEIVGGPSRGPPEDSLEEKELRQKERQKAQEVARRMGRLGFEA